MKENKELIDKYPMVTKENKYKYLGLKIYEVNNNIDNEEFIYNKISETLEIIKKLELNNKNTIKCINVQVMSQLRYFIGPVVFTIQCLNKIDKLVNKTLKEMNYRNEKQSTERMYLSNKYLGGNLMSARDIHLRCLIKLYKEIKEREKKDTLKEIDDELNNKWKTRSLLQAIKKHQKYLKIDKLMNMINKIEDKEELDKYLKVCIENYHLNKWKKKGKSQAINLINFMDSIQYNIY